MRGVGARALSAGEAEKLLGLLESRFGENGGRHEGLEWAAVRSRLEVAPGKLRSLREMEATGGEPDVVSYDAGSGEVVFVDCSAQSPLGRRSLCYDRKALESRRQRAPKGSAEDAAAAMGVEILTEEAYRSLQRLGAFDTTTSSWVRTPPEIRRLGGALFCDRRYGHVFVYHNGAESYYAARGFRASLKV